MIDALREHPYRWGLTVFLVLLTLVAGVGSAVGRWSHDVLFDTETFLEVVGPISSDEEISAALSDEVSVRLIDFLEPGARLERLLPPLLQPFVQQLTVEVENLVREEVDKFFRSELYDELWLGLNRTAHTAIVAIIQDQVPFASTADGVVTVDFAALVSPIIDALIERIRNLAAQLPPELVSAFNVDETIRELVNEYEEEGLPEEWEAVVVYESDRLRSIQQSVATFDRLVLVLPILTLAFGAAAVWAAPHRRVMLWVLPLLLAAIWLVSVVVVDAIVASILDGISSDNAVSVASAVLTGITDSLDTLLAVLIVLALVAAAVAAVVWWRHRPVTSRVLDEEE